MSDSNSNNSNGSNVHYVCEKDFLLKFIKLYRDLPVLWKVTSDDYNHKSKRAEAIRSMVENLKQTRPDITEEDVKKKINTIRTSFNRELNRVKRSQLSETKYIYLPTLWYFNELKFLLNQEEEEDDDEETSISYIIDSSEAFKTSSPSSLFSVSHRSESQATTRTTGKSLPTKRQRLGRLINENDSDLIHLAKRCYARNESESAVVAKSWMFKLDRMRSDQRRLAERFINEILFEGESENLTRDSVRINLDLIPKPSPSHSPDIIFTQSADAFSS